MDGCGGDLSPQGDGGDRAPAADADDDPDVPGRGSRPRQRP